MFPKFVLWAIGRNSMLVLMSSTATCIPLQCHCEKLIFTRIIIMNPLSIFNWCPGSESPVSLLLKNSPGYNGAFSSTICSESIGNYVSYNHGIVSPTISFRSWKHIFNGKNNSWHEPCCVPTIHPDSTKSIFISALPEDLNTVEDWSGISSTVVQEI